MITNLRKTLFLSCLVASFSLGTPARGQTPWLELVPSTTSVLAVGEEFQVTAWVHGLGNGVAPSLDAYRLGVYYDASFIETVPDPGNPSAPKLDLHNTNIYPPELLNGSSFTSFTAITVGGASSSVLLLLVLPDVAALHAHQSDSFELFTLYLRVVAHPGSPETTPISFGRAFDDSVLVSVRNDDATVSQFIYEESSADLVNTSVLIPEPALAWIPGVVLVGLLVVLRRVRRTNG